MLNSVEPSSLSSGSFSFTPYYSTSDVLCWGAASNGQVPLLFNLVRDTHEIVNSFMVFHQFSDVAVDVRIVK